MGFRFSPLDKDRDVSHTVTTREGGRKTSTFIYDGGRLRRLTPREAWRLQGFPDWAFDRAEKVCGITELYKQAGNSIAVPVIGAVFRTIQEADSGKLSGVTLSDWFGAPIRKRPSTACGPQRFPYTAFQEPRQPLYPGGSEPFHDNCAERPPQ